MTTMRSTKSDDKIKPKSGVRFVTVTIKDILNSLLYNPDFNGAINKFFCNMYQCIDKTLYNSEKQFVFDVCSQIEDDSPVATIAYQIADIVDYYNNRDSIVRTYNEGYIVGYSLISRKDAFNAKKGRRCAQASLNRMIEYRNTKLADGVPLRAADYNGFLIYKSHINDYVTNLFARNRLTNETETSVFNAFVESAKVLPDAFKLRNINQGIKRDMVIDFWLTYMFCEVNSNVRVNNLKFISSNRTVAANSFYRFIEQTKLSIENHKHKRWLGDLFDYFTTKLCMGQFDERYHESVVDTDNAYNIEVFKSKDGLFSIYRLAKSEEHAEYLRNIPIFVKARELFGDKTLDEIFGSNAPKHVFGEHSWVIVKYDFIENLTRKSQERFILKLAHKAMMEESTECNGQE